MAFSNLNPFSLPWQTQGLHYLLSTGEPAPAVDKPRTDEKTVRPIPQRPAFSARTGPGEAAARSNGNLWQPTPHDRWPIEWQEQLARVKKAHIAWTYWQLGADLAGREDPKRKMRSDFLRRLIRDLGHPAGTHTFWPPCLWNGAEWTAHRDAFWSGLRELNCRGVVIMGAGASRALLSIEKPTPLTRHRMYGQFVWLMWDIEILAAQPQVYERMLSYMREALKSFCR